MGAGDPVQEQHAVAVVEFVLQGPGLEGVLSRGGLTSPVPGASPSTTTRVARFTSPVRSGTDMQPSRPFSLRDCRGVRR